MTRVTEVRTQGCPDANGRQPLSGDEKYTLKFPLEDGSYLFVSMGKSERDAVRDMLLQQDADDTKERGETPS